MYEFDQWVIWSGLILSAVEIIKIFMTRYDVKSKLDDNTYQILLTVVAFILGLFITFGYEADLFASMMEEPQDYQAVGQIAGALILAFGETVLSEVWDAKALYRLFKDRLAPKPDTQ